MPQSVRALVFTAAPGDRSRAGRTLRALKALGLVPEEVGAEPPALGGAPVWLVRAGAWPRAASLSFPPPSHTGRPLCALGLPRPAAGRADEAAAWAALQADTGGDLSALPDLAARLPPVVSAYLDAPAAAALARGLAAGAALPDALRAEIASGHRVIRHAPLDVHTDDGLRVVQVVTSLQRGGAERVAIDLHRHLGGRGVRSRLVALGRPTRAPFPAPPGTLDLSGVRGRPARIDAAHRAALDFAADLVHAHLLRGEEMARLAALGLPVVATVHNARPGWPPGLDALRPADAALLLACSQAVEADVRAAALSPAVRTAWNGIDFAPFERTPALVAKAADVRRRLGLAPGAFVLLALANPRPQKRLDRLPAVLAATRARLAPREARLVIAGEASAGDEATRCVESLRAEVARLGLGEHVRLTGAADDVAPLLAAADVLVSASLYEGLSLAYLEALAAGLPVVATDAGGTAEVALDNPALTVLPVGASADQFADALARVAGAPPAGGREAASAHFSTARMVERHAWLSPRKRLEDLLAAVHLAHPRLPPYVLRIAGGVERDCDDYAAGLRRLAAGLPVEWVGDWDDVRPFLAGLDLFAMISEPAGCPNASLEAMAAGLPVVATDCGGASEQVIDGVTGRLVPPRDARALAGALVDLANDPGKRAACGSAGRARAEALFDLRRMISDYRHVIGC